MGIGVSIFLIAVGAILTFAVHVSTSGFNIHTIGIILMVVGAIGLITSMILWAPRRTRARTTAVYDDAYAPPAPGTARRVVREDTYNDSL